LITSTGLICIPIGLVAFFMAWCWMLAVLLIFSTMSAAAVVMIGSVGLSPGYYMILLAILRVLIGALRDGLPISREILPPLGSLVLFLVAAVISLWAAGVFFQGNVIVLNGSDQFQLTLAAPFQFRRENVTQLCYLAVSVTLTIALGVRLSRVRSHDLAEMIDYAMISCIIFTDLLCLWHWLSHNTSFIAWPHDFFFSNKSYAPREDQVMLDEVRLSGPFSEPSSLAAAYGGFLFYSLQRFRIDGSVTSMLLVLSNILVLFLTKSSTGLLLIGLFVVVVLAKPIVQALTGSLRSPRITPAGLTAIGLAFAATLAMSWYVVAHKEFVSNLFDALIFKKQESSSYRERSGSNLMALQILIDTGGIGIGIGSHKPSSFLLTVLSNTGIAGTLMLALFLYQIMKLPRNSVAGQHKTERLIGSPLQWSILGTLATLAISGPNLSNASLWTCFGLEFALLGSLATDRRRLNGSQQRSAVEPSHIDAHSGNPAERGHLAMVRRIG
jgi:hypothetical protein